MQEHGSGLNKAANIAGTVHGAVKTGKALAAAAKGAAAGGPYGAAAGLAIGAAQHAKTLLLAAVALLLLPVLFVLMLPSLIFGGLTGGGNAGQPILNDDAAITANIGDIAFAVSEALGEGIADAEERIAYDFAGTDGDSYEIINPYAANMTGSTNAFIAQYCAAKGEDYFADTVFHLTEEQKLLAGDYAQNLSLFLDDGMFQYTEYDGTTIAALGDVRFTDGAVEVVYFNQKDKWLFVYS